MAAVRLSVETASLQQLSGTCTDILRRIRNHSGQIENISRRTRGYWRGSAADLGREGYAACLEELLGAVERVEESSYKLLDLARVYQKAENAVAEVNTSIQTGLQS